MKAQVLGNAVLIRPLTEEEKKVGSIIVPPSVRNQIHEGEVVSIGRGLISGGVIIPPEVKVGDKVLYTNHQVAELEVEGETLYAVQENNIILIKE
jgi:chaperonin GroES